VVVPVIYTYLDDLAQWARIKFGTTQAAIAVDPAHHAQGAE
jgi:hypothetical protein